jgi:DNA-binding XRE family transcriptional regulator
MSKAGTQQQMGQVSNLITDMTLKGATESELARAVKHSMVVIDAAKHNLDYKRSEKENGIAELKKKYQGRIENGKYTESASTLISRAKAQASVPKRQGTPKINEDGTLTYKTADDLYYIDKKTGKEKMRTQKSKQMLETSDARTLSSGTLKEEAYASYANQMKALANKARKEIISTGKIEYSRAAKETYQKEVDSLNRKLDIAQANAPRERRAQIIANSKVDAKKKEYPELTKKDLKKIAQQELTRARELVGAERTPVEIEPREWEAIQAGAISETKLKQILDHTDLDDIRKYATPRNQNTLSDAKISQIKSMNASGYTNKEIADRLGVSTSTIAKYL